jgi:hypothetical protein
MFRYGRTLMNLTYSFKKARDLFDKMIRDADALEDTVSGDRAFNFVITAFHLKEWVEQDHSVPQSVKDDLGKISNNKYFQICRDLANASKHMVITRYQPSTADASSIQGWNVGRYGKGPYGVGEEGIKITHSDGSVISIIELKDNVVWLWKDFFHK